MRYPIPACLLACLLSAAPYAEEVASPEQADEASTRRCLPIGSIRSTRVLDDQTIVFVMRGKPDYVNKLPNRCPGLGFYKSFGYATGLSSVCDLDIITVIESNRRGASCGLGAFVEYDPATEEVEEKARPDAPTEGEEAAQPGA